METHDVGMVELAKDVDLALEALLKADLDGQFGGQDLDGRKGWAVTSIGGAMGLVDSAHASAADFFIDDPRAKSNAYHEWCLGVSE
jgi:hypothetical protein